MLILRNLDVCQKFYCCLLVNYKVALPLCVNNFLSKITFWVPHNSSFLIGKRNYSLINILYTSYLGNIEYIKSRVCLFLSLSIASWYIGCIIFAYLQKQAPCFFSNISPSWLCASNTQNVHGNNLLLHYMSTIICKFIFNVFILDT